MGLIVHLTDLHLGRGGAESPADDRKIRVVSDVERTSIRDVAEDELRRLADAIRDRGLHISALVLSGDITVRGQPEGYADLPSFLSAAFGSILPPSGRIVVTPGNHDVAWFEADPTKRYEHFITHCADAGYITPPLDGIDLVGGDFLSDVNRHLLMDDEGWFVVPLNTSNWSGTEAALVDDSGNEVPTSLIAELRRAVASDAAHAKLVEQLLGFRRFDMPRVSKAQIKAFEQIVARARQQLGVAAMAIAVMHHQLSPVGEREEIKPFESLSNLGRVRGVLQERDVAMTLHGHKHDVLTMWNTTELGSIDGRGRDKHEMLVVSGGTIGGSTTPDPTRFATVIEVRRMLKGHEVRVRSGSEFVRDQDRGARAYFLDGSRFEPLGARGGHIEAGGFSDAYARLIAEGAAAKALVVKNVSVTVSDLAEVGRPPAGYPSDAVGAGGVLPLDEWFREVADWWQSELIEAPRGIFTHGRRLKLHRGQLGADQIAVMAKTLQDRAPTNGRAIAILVEPGTDLFGAHPAAPATFPAFCLLQLHVRNEASATFLDATAYFRKQEMRYWWPVNVSEIKRVMDTVLLRLKGVQIGSITTVAAVAVWQTSRSRVSIPAIDRAFLQSEEGRIDLLRLAALIAQPHICPTHENKRLGRLWRTVLEDVVPPSDAVMDSIPVAVEGIGFLKRAVRAQKDVAEDDSVRERLDDVAVALEKLEEGGAELWGLGRQEKSRDYEARLKQKVQTMTTARARLLALLAHLPGFILDEGQNGE